MRRLPAVIVALLAAALALPAAPAAAKGVVGMSVCGADGCVDRSALVRDVRGHGEALMGSGDNVADPGRGAFLRLKLHVGDPATRERFDAVTLIYLTQQGLIRTEDGSWFDPGQQAANLYERAARRVTPFPATALKPFGTAPTPAAADPVPETGSPAPPRAPAPTARDGGGRDVPAVLLGGAVVAIVLAAGGAYVLTRRGRTATG